MKNATICFVLLLITVNTMQAQVAAKAAYVELGGPGLFSANYDMRIQKKENGLGFRVGVGGFSVRAEDLNGTNRVGFTTFPVGLNYLIGKNTKHYFETGAGITFILIKTSSSGNSSFDNETFNENFGHLYVGYRLQPKQSGFLFRGGFSPLFTANGFFPFAGISLGYKF